MGYSRKWVNNTASPVALTITSTTEFTGYLGSVSISAYSALYATTDVPELDLAAGRGTVDKYLNNKSSISLALSSFLLHHAI